MSKIPEQIKYLVIPGNVTSRSDGDIHFISARELMRLHGVSRNECIVLEDSESLRGFTQDFRNSLQVLAPRSDGKYEL